MPKYNIVYAYPMWHTVSFTLVAKKHIEHLKKRKNVNLFEIDELSFPTYVPISKPVAYVHPAIFIGHRIVKARSDTQGVFRWEYFNWWKSHFQKLIGIDVCDSDRMSSIAVGILNLYDILVVPSNFCVKVYKDSGVRKPVVRIPHGVEKYWYEMPNVWETKPVKDINPSIVELYLYKMKKKKKVLLFWLWHSGERKGFPEVALVYRLLRRKRNDVILVMKTGIPNPIEVQQLYDIGVVNIYGWLKEEDKMALYDLADINLNFSRGGGFELNCVPPDTLIITKDGLKEIKDIKEGDYVLTHKGRFRKVTKTFIRPHRDKIIEIIPYGFENISLKLTPEHPILILESSKFKQRKRNKVLSLEPVWKDARYVRKGDAVLIPIPKEEYKNVVFDLAEFIKDDIDKGIATVEGDYIYYKATGSPRFSEISYETIRDLTGETKKIVCKAVKAYLTGAKVKSERIKKVVRLLEELQYRPAHIKIKRFVKLDKNLAKIIGYYLAEGSINESNWAVEFSFGNEPELVADLVSSIIESFGYLPSIYRYEDRNLTKVVICNKAVARFLLALCGKLAKNKVLPPQILFGDKEILSWTIWSMILGDGHIERDRILYTTKSRILAFSVFMALIRLGYKPRIHYHKTQDEFIIYVSLPKELRTEKLSKDPNTCFLKPRNSDYILHSNKTYLDFKRGYLVLLIREVRRIDYDGYVYNLEVDEDNSYTANMITVHNCLEALARGVPCIASNWGSWVDYVPEFLRIKPGERHVVLPGNKIHIGYGYAVDVRDAVDKINDILDNYEEYKAKTEEWRMKVLSKEYRWDLVTTKLFKLAKRS